MFKSNIKISEKVYYEIFLEGDYEKSFGIYSKDIVEKVLEEVKEYISEQLKRSIFFKISWDRFQEIACQEITGKSCDEWFDFIKDDFDVYQNMIDKVSERFDEIWFKQFGDISEEEFGDLFEKVYKHEYFTVEDIPKIREVIIYEGVSE